MADLKRKMDLLPAHWIKTKPTQREEKIHEAKAKNDEIKMGTRNWL
jgi:hypothetical protein